MTQARTRREAELSAPIDHHQAAQLLPNTAKIRLTALAEAVCNGGFHTPNEVRNLEGELETLERAFGTEAVGAFYTGRLGLFSQPE